MKTLIILASLFLSTLAHGESEVRVTSQEQVRAIIQKNLWGSDGRTFDGRTQDQGPCGLYISLYDGDGNAVNDVYRVVVGNMFDKPINHDSYVGLLTSKIEVSGTTSKMTLKSNESWGNSSTENTLVIEMNVNGVPIRVTGINNLRTFTCNL
jgi:hypothetical protein